jgi:hypothetical protein
VGTLKGRWTLLGSRSHSGKLLDELNQASSSYLQGTRGSRGQKQQLVCLCRFLQDSSHCSGFG